MADAYPIPDRSFMKKTLNIFQDAGYYWHDISIFNSLQILDLKNDLIPLSQKSNIFDMQINNKGLNGKYFGNVVFKKSFYIFADLNTYGLNLINSSGMGFQNHWVNLQIGKGREEWSAGNDIELALSKNAYPYDYFKLSSDYGRVRVSYFHGFLERTEDNVNRFINARGFEWTNKRSIIIGFSETIIYSGFNRSMDFAYLNPIGSHLELELNNRLNKPGDFNSNAVWQMHLDIHIKRRSRLSLNFLIDEFVIDPNIQIGKEHGRAHSIKYSYAILKKNKNICNVNFSNTYIGTPTFRHGMGTNNFVNKGIPLGWQYGSDASSFNIGLSYLKFQKLLIDLSFSFNKSGEEDIRSRPYEPYKDYIKDTFPSGTISTQKYLNSSFHWQKSEYEIYFKSKLIVSSNEQTDYEILLGVSSGF